MFWLYFTKRLLLCPLFVAFSLGLSCHEYGEAYRAIDSAITLNPHLIPSLVRLAFHDCVGRACDGCLNFHSPNNAGLLPVSQLLESIYTSNDCDLPEHFSRSDFWQLSAHVALIRGGLNQGCGEGERCPFFSLQYASGRRDCPSSPSHFHTDDTGDAHGGFGELSRVLGGSFGLSPSEIVTLLGCHSLGGAEKHNSGFEYNWQKFPLTFDNSFFRNLASLDYQHLDVSSRRSPPRVEFTASDEKLLMLNTDMSIWKDLRAVEKQGEYTGGLLCYSRGGRRVGVADGVVGEVEKCEDAPTAGLVRAYAKDVRRFFGAFPGVWWKMSSHGFDDLKRPREFNGESCGYCIPEDAYCVKGFEKAGKCCPGYDCIHHRCQKGHQ